MQHHVILSDEPWGLPLDKRIMPQYFKDAGYQTTLIGKWHLGFARNQFTPNERGFDSFFGYLGPFIGYYDYSLIMRNRNYSRGYDMRRNQSVAHFNDEKPYATELFTREAVNAIKNHDKNVPMFLMVNHLAPHAGNDEPDEPLEAPQDEIDKFSFIENEKRRKLAAMISILDKSVGDIVNAIDEKGLTDNTIIMFLSDNGGPTVGIHSTQSSNYPLRGQKAGLWEGGTRIVACISSPLLKSTNRVSNELMHITDLLPTLLSASNISSKHLNSDEIDGVDQWKTISEGEASPRKEILYNYDDVRGFSAFMLRGWKIVNGTDNIEYAGWLGESGFKYFNITHEEYFQTVTQSKVGRILRMPPSDVVRNLRSDAKVECGNEGNDDVEHATIPCNPLKRPCLFNVIQDPCERENLAKSKPEIIRLLLSQLTGHVLETLPALRIGSDPNSDPKLHNFTWSPWLDDEIIEDQHFPPIVIAILIFLPLLFVMIAKVKRCR